MITTPSGIIIYSIAEMDSREALQKTRGCKSFTCSRMAELRKNIQDCLVEKKIKELAPSSLSNTRFCILVTEELLKIYENYSGKVNEKAADGFTEAGWRDLQEIYSSVFIDILEGRNLERHLKDVQGAIVDLETIISSYGGKPTPALDEIKNDFYYLKYLILERT